MYQDPMHGTCMYSVHVHVHVCVHVEKPPFVFTGNRGLSVSAGHQEDNLRPHRQARGYRELQREQGPQ